MIEGTGVVDEDRQIAAHRRGRHNLVRFGHVELHGNDPAGRFRDEMRRSFRIAGADIDFLCPGGDEGSDKSFADAAVAAGDQRDAVFNVHRSGPFGGAGDQRLDMGGDGLACLQLFKQATVEVVAPAADEAVPKFDDASIGRRDASAVGADIFCAEAFR